MQIKTTMKDVEFPLIKSELKAIDVKLLNAETTLFWNGEGVKAIFRSNGSNPPGTWSSCGISDPPIWAWGGPDSEGTNDVCYPSALPFWKFSTISSASGSGETEGLAQSCVTVMIVKSAFAKSFLL